MNNPIKKPEKKDIDWSNDRTAIDAWSSCCDKWEEYVKALEAEIARMRNYCLNIFGNSHPEIKKCSHEIKADVLMELLEGKKIILLCPKCGAEGWTKYTNEPEALKEIKDA